MSPRLLLRTALALVVASALSPLAACTDRREGVRSSASAASERATLFDPNDVLDDASMTDTSMTSDDVQAFLEMTPYGSRSALADYAASSKRTAAQVIAEEAEARDINPMLLLVRIQLESGLVSKKRATAAELARAFGCGAPGFEGQARCAASQLRTALDRVTGKRVGSGSGLRTTDGTAAGWAVDKKKTTRDGIVVIPANAATAVLYAYQPWVGSLGDGDPTVGGVSALSRLWLDFTGTAEPTCEGATCGCVTNADCEGADQRCDRLHGVCVDRPQTDDTPDAETRADASASTDAGSDASTTPPPPSSEPPPSEPLPNEPTGAPVPELPEERGGAPSATNAGRKDDEPIDVSPSQNSGCAVVQRRTDLGVQHGASLALALVALARRRARRASSKENRERDILA
ncbi:MAG: hypothetical protein JST00_18360 [Deltaproteobacteria bacterium]|nr:hypothetical protein [Deltaproteobacteria bacterium]